MINFERALYFSEKFKKLKKISPFLICIFILILKKKIEKTDKNLLTTTSYLNII
jgi:hypothetical protein